MVSRISDYDPKVQIHPDDMAGIKAHASANMEEIKGHVAAHYDRIGERIELLAKEVAALTKAVEDLVGKVPSKE